MNKKFMAIIMLTSTTLIWGTSFIAQVWGMAEIGPFAFVAARYLLAALSTYLMVLCAHSDCPWSRCIKGGVLCGCALFLGTVLQQYGLLRTSAGKTAFITTLYIIIVPLLGIFSKKYPSWKMALTVAAATIGLYFICVKEDFSIASSDLVVLVGSFFWALHIICCGKFSYDADPVKLSAIQFATVSLLGFAGMLMFEDFTPAAILASWKPIVYASVVCSAVAYTLQMIGQRYVSPTTASIIFSGEAVFACIFGYFLLNETLSCRELFGCAILLCAVVAAQIIEIKDAEKINM